VGGTAIADDGMMASARIVAAAATMTVSLIMIYIHNDIVRKA